MKQSLTHFLAKCIIIKAHLDVQSFEFHYYEDGSFVDFCVMNINDPKQLQSVIGKYRYKIFFSESCVVVRVYDF